MTYQARTLNFCELPTSSTSAPEAALPAAAHATGDDEEDGRVPQLCEGPAKQYDVRQSDMTILAPGGLLNDKIINAFLSLIAHRGIRWIMLNSHFMRKSSVTDVSRSYAKIVMVRFRGRRKVYADAHSWNFGRSPLTMHRSRWLGMNCLSHVQGMGMAEDTTPDVVIFPVHKPPCHWQLIVLFPTTHVRSVRRRRVSGRYAPPCIHQMTSPLFPGNANISLYGSAELPQRRVQANI